MRNWKRYEKARKLRAAGKTLKAIGTALGVGTTRVRQMLATQERHAADQAEIDRLQRRLDNLLRETQPWLMGHCHKCGTPRHDGDSACQHCGVSLLRSQLWHRKGHWIDGR